jgi:hypothetical protein
MDECTTRVYTSLTYYTVSYKKPGLNKLTVGRPTGPPPDCAYLIRFQDLFSVPSPMLVLVCDEHALVIREYMLTAFVFLAYIYRNQIWCTWTTVCHFLKILKFVLLFYKNQNLFWEYIYMVHIFARNFDRKLVIFWDMEKNKILTLYRSYIGV